MDAIERLKKHSKDRIAELYQLKKENVKIVGYVPEGYLPEELVYASGAIPLGLAKGGSSEMVAESLKYIPRFFCTWCRSQIGYKMDGDPLYQLPDLMVVPITDINAKTIYDMWSYWTDTPTFTFGVPHEKNEDAYNYFLDGLHLFKNRLEELTGNKITESRLVDEIEKQNKIRSLLKSISYLRTCGKPAISSLDYVQLHHNSFVADKDFLISCLTEIYDELKKQPPAKDDKVRIYFTGSTLAAGDYRMYELLDQVGGEIIFEDFAGGLRPYRDNVELNGKDPMVALADAYFMKRIDPAWNRPSKHRVNQIIDEIKEFGCQAMVWYQMLYREGYDLQWYYFDRIIREKTNVPTLKISSDYDIAEMGYAKTRLESLIEIVQGG